MSAVLDDLFLFSCDAKVDSILDNRCNKCGRIRSVSVTTKLVQLAKTTEISEIANNQTKTAPKNPNAQHIWSSEPNCVQACNIPTLTACCMHAMAFSHFALAFVSSIPILIYAQLLELLHGNNCICIFCIHPAVEDDYDDVIRVINVFHEKKIISFRYSTAVISCACKA